MPGDAGEKIGDRLMATKIDTRYVDRDALVIARLVARAEGITLEQALAEELELWAGVNA